jgi:hypothetical protein
MPARIIDGKAEAERLRKRIAAAVGELKSRHGLIPGLAVVLVGEDPASHIYVRNKARQTVEVGMNSWEHRLEATTPEAVRQALDDRAVRPIVAVAMLGEMEQSFRDRLDLAHLGAQCLDVVERDPLHVGRGPILVAPQRQQIADLGHRKAQVAGAADEGERVDVVVGIDAIARGLLAAAPISPMAS